MRERVLAMTVLGLALGLGNQQVPAAPFASAPGMGQAARQIARAIHTNVRMALRAHLVIKPGERIEVEAAAVEPGGRYLGTGLGDGSVGLWDLRQGREVQRLRHGGAGVRAVALGGSVLASGGADGQVLLWRVPRGGLLARVAAHQGAVTALSLDVNARVLGSAGEDGVIRIIDVVSGRATGRLTGHQGAVRALALSRDGRSAASGGADGSVRLWDLASGRTRRTLDGHPGGVLAIALSADGERLASAAGDGSLRVWDTVSGRVLQSLDGEGARVRTLAYSREGAHLASGGEDQRVCLYELPGGSLHYRLQGHTQPVTAVVFDARNELLYSGSLDGSGRVWDLARGEEQAQVITSVSGWTVVDRAGQFDGSRAGAAAVQWQTTEGPFELEQFSERHFQPGVLARIVNDGARAERVQAIPQGFPVPPSVRVSSRGGSGNLIKVTVQARASGGAVSEVRLYHNGKRVDPQSPGLQTLSRAPAGGETTVELDTQLLPGENVFRASALNTERIEGRPVELRVSRGGRAEGGVLYLLAVGINHYRNPALNLDFGVPDARGLRDYYRLHGTRRFREVRVYELLDDAATGARLREQLAALRETRPEDVVVLYLAGHGETSGGEWHFVPQDLLYPNRPQELARAGLSSAEILGAVARMPAQRVLVLLDACKSGAALRVLRGYEDRKPLEELARLAGVHVLAATAQDQLASELPQLGHGLFTYALLQGLAGRADQSPKDGNVTAVELVRLVETWVPDLSEKYHTRLQFPVTDSRGRDFTVAGGP